MTSAEVVGAAYPVELCVGIVAMVVVYIREARRERRARTRASRARQPPP